jgi:hypothetical protein
LVVFWFGLMNLRSFWISWVVVGRQYQWCSPACRDRIGQKIGRARLDIWGDRLQCEPLHAGLFTGLSGTTGQMGLMRMPVSTALTQSLSRVVATCGVTELFQHLIPPAARDRPCPPVQAARKPSHAPHRLY